MLLNQFYKVNNSGFSCTWSTFFNPVTKESFEKRVWDIDDPRIEQENAELYAMPVDELARKEWLHFRGVAFPGDKVVIVKGRKIPVGEVKTISKEWKYQVNKITYIPGLPKQRPQYVYYWIFTDGTRTNQDNCKLLQE